MKKNEKNFMQDENNLKDVSGGLFEGVSTKVNTDLKFNYTKTTDNSTHHTGNDNKNVNIGENSNVNFSGTIKF